MNNPQTVAEVARVLRDGGRFAVVRIGRGEGSRWQVELAAEVGLDADVQQVEDEQAWSLRLDDDAPFEPVERAEFPFVHTMTVDDVANSLGTFSSVIALGQEGAADIVRRAREALVGRFGSDVDVAVELRATVDRCTRLAR
jgi:SAM-dependent methyltransferase